MAHSRHERMAGKIRLEPNGCWVWTGFIMPNGYAQFWAHGTKQYAHRFAYEQMRGAIPDGYDIDHVCRNRACVRPGHLQAVTHAENVRRGLKGSLVTVCAGGHTYTPESTYLAPNGTRKCRLCRREAKRRSAARLKAVRSTT